MKKQKDMEKKKLTAANGRPIADNQNVQTAGFPGPMVQDPWYLEKLAHFDREVIPERRMHAKGSGAYGTFTVTHDITAYTRAAIFSEVGKKTDCFVRFSTVAGERGAADAERDIRGFAMKFYTEEGNWDLVGRSHISCGQGAGTFQSALNVAYQPDHGGDNHGIRGGGLRYGCQRSCKRFGPCGIF